MDQECSEVRLSLKEPGMAEEEKGRYSFGVAETAREEGSFFYQKIDWNICSDDCGADGYAGSMYTITFAAATHFGQPPSYSGGI